MKQEELNKILQDHEKWLRSEGEKRANLQGFDLREVDLQGVNLQWANLQGVNLQGAHLREADLRWADLREANLQEANLQGVNLQWANLQWANLQGVNLEEANLQGANLQWANLQGVNLEEANLQGANLQEANLQEANLQWANLRLADLKGADLRNCFALQLQCPESGGFTAYKKLANELICELWVLPEAKRSSATARKCRCDKAKIISITDKDGNEYTYGFSVWDSNFKYRVGEIVEVENFNEDRWNECSAGIHFFITKQEATDY